MPQIQSYKGIDRITYPDWLGWIILDLLEQNPNAARDHIVEIKVQLDYEVKYLNQSNKT